MANVVDILRERVEVIRLRGTKTRISKMTWNDWEETHKDFPLKQRREVLKTLLEGMKARSEAEYYSTMIYLIAMQEQHRIRTALVSSEPYRNVLDFTRENLRAMFWFLQGSRLAQLDFHGMGIVRQVMIKAHKVATHEKEFQSGDWNIMEQMSKRLLLGLGCSEDYITDIGVLLISVVEDENGLPTPQLLSRELEGTLTMPDLKRSSEWWLK